MSTTAVTTKTLTGRLTALLLGSMVCGAVFGTVFTHQANQTTKPAVKTDAMVWGTVANTAGRSGKQSLKQAKSYTTLAAVTDPALPTLLASKTLHPTTKKWVGYINPIKLDRPTWGWSREALHVANARVETVFGAPKRAPKQKATVQLKKTVAAALPVKPVMPKASVPTQAATTPAAGKRRLVVALDPGHGGIDPGSEAYNGLIEKELTLDMAKRVQLFLSEVNDVDVIMTRTTDTGMSRQSRVETIKAAGADVVVSLHFNHLPQKNINLVETFYADRHNIIESLEKQKRPTDSVNLDFTNASRQLAGIMHKKVHHEVASRNPNVVDAGVKQDTLFVLTRSFAPGVLLELTCISNPAEADRLVSESYRNQLAAAIADGLRDYLMKQRSGRIGELLANLDLNAPNFNQ